jgi:cell division protein FtsQ
VTVDPPRRGLFHRRGNRRITVSSPSVAVWIAQVVQAAVHRGWFVLKAIAAVLVLAGAAWGGELAMRHVVASPRFALREIRVAPTERVSGDEILALAGVAEGDKLLAIDTDVVAARVASHPWVASARVRRELPSALAIDVLERRAAGVAVLGALYLIGDNGRPFKRATLEEAEGLVLLTGLTRTQYATFRDASEAAYREALKVADAYRSVGAAQPARPPLSEIHIDPRYGFSLVLEEGGGEVRLGRGDYPDKLERLDRILAGLRTLATGPPSTVRTIHLDGPNRDRVAIQLATPPTNH